MPGQHAMGRLQQQDEWRKKIQASQLINRLNDHGLGIVEMSATQVKAAQALIAKVLPDLKAVEHSGTIITRYETLSEEELNARIAVLLEKINISKPGDDSIKGDVE